MPDRIETITDHPATWLLGPADFAAIHADAGLLRRLAAHQCPDDTEPVGARLAAFLGEVEGGCAR